MTRKRKCPNCEKAVHGHPNKKFCNSRCKDRYHNRNNPRGFGLYRDDNDRFDPDPWHDEHPFSSEGLGQW